MTMVFLGATVLVTMKGKLGVWKSNTLALLFHGLGSWFNDKERLARVSAMNERAGRMQVKMVDDEGDWGRLVERRGFEDGVELNGLKGRGSWLLLSERRGYLRYTVITLSLDYLCQYRYRTNKFHEDIFHDNMVSLP